MPDSMQAHQVCCLEAGSVYASEPMGQLHSLVVLSSVKGELQAMHSLVYIMVNEIWHCAQFRCVSSSGHSPCAGGPHQVRLHACMMCNVDPKPQRHPQ